MVESGELSHRQRAAIIRLCNAAYGEDVEAPLQSLAPATHVLGTLGRELVSHAMWVTRWLQPRGRSPLQTAYVEMVATSPAYRAQGHATRIMRQLHEEIVAFELAALCPADTSLYARLGWEPWRGPLYIRGAKALQPTPDERIVVRRLPRTPADLDLDAALSAEWRPGELW